MNWHFVQTWRGLESVGGTDFAIGAPQREQNLGSNMGAITLSPQ
jgi:hypothetical protein